MRQLLIKMEPDRQLQKARDYAYRLLSHRQRSVQEIRERLRKKNFSASIINQTIKYLSGLNYLNDRDFARAWVCSKIASSYVGLSMLRYQLKQKGISDELIDETIDTHALNYDEVQAAQKLVALRRKHYRAVEPVKVKKRLYDYLRRRGFSAETIFQAIKDSF